MPIEKMLTMNKLNRSAVIVALLAGSATAIACDYPDRVDLPNGATATKEEMIEGVKAIKAWQQALVEYRVCIDDETNAQISALSDSGSSAEEQEASTLALKKKLIEKHDASVEDEQRLAAEFNEQLGLFKQRK
jgi:hypothetical protein